MRQHTTISYNLTKEKEKGYDKHTNTHDFFSHVDSHNVGLFTVMWLGNMVEQGT